MAAEGEQGDHQPAASAVRVDLVDERTVDLDEFGPELGDDLHAGVPGTRVVDGDAVTAGAQLRRNSLQAGEIRHRVALAELQDDRRWVEPGMADGSLQCLQALPLAEQGTDQDVDEDVGGLQVGRLAQRGAKAGQVDRALHAQS